MASPVRALDGTYASLAGKVPNRLLAELQDEQDAATLEGRVLAGVTDLFEEMAVEERRRRVSWEEKADRNLRDLRAGVESDLARAGCESRRLFTEAKREAAEARKMVQPCYDFVAAIERQEALPSLSLVVRREVQLSMQAEVDRLGQHFRQQLTESLTAASRENAELLAIESSKWAEACAGQMADVISKEQQAREFSIAALEERLGNAHGREQREATQQKQELVEVAEAMCMKASNEAEAHLGSLVVQLQEAHVTLQAVLDRYAERWERAWREEADSRIAGDKEANQRFEAMAVALEQRARVFEQAVEQTALEAQAQAQLQASEARSRQENEQKLLMRLGDMHKELRMESDVRGGTDSRLSAGLEQLRTLVAQAVASGRLGPVQLQQDVTPQPVRSLQQEFSPQPIRSQASFEPVAESAVDDSMQTVAGASLSSGSVNGGLARVASAGCLAPVSSASPAVLRALPPPLPCPATPVAAVAAPSPLRGAARLLR